MLGPPGGEVPLLDALYAQQLHQLTDIISSERLRRGLSLVRKEGVQFGQLPLTLGRCPNGAIHPQGRRLSASTSDCPRSMQ